MTNGQIERMTEVKQAEGFHMRPAMQFVDCASRFESSISVCKGDQCVDGKSIMQLTMLAATKGTQLKIVAEGIDAQDAVDALVMVIENETND
jgi:phosphocarrier protein